MDELLLGGEIQETSKKNVLKGIAAQDLLQEVCQLNYTNIQNLLVFVFNVFIDSKDEVVENALKEFGLY